MAEEESENYENDLIDSGLIGILGMLNFKIVPKEPGDPSYCEFNEVIPPESRLYAAEYVRLQDKYDKLKEEMRAMASSSELQVREELTETKEALARERKKVEEVKEARANEQKAAEEALAKVRKEAEETQASDQRKAEEALAKIQTEARDALVTVQKEAEEAKSAALAEQGKSEKLRDAIEEMKEQLNDCETKNQQQNELLSSNKTELEEARKTILEKDKEIQESSQISENLRNQNEEMGKISRLDKENLAKLQNENEQLEKDLREFSSTNSQLQEKCSETNATNCELQGKLDTLKEKIAEIEDKLTEEIAKCDEYKVRQTQYETIEQTNRELDEQVADLQRKLRDKTSEVENVQKDLNTEREEKSRLETTLTRYRESLQSCTPPVALPPISTRDGYFNIMPPPQVTNSGLANTQSSRSDNITLTNGDVTTRQVQEAFSETNLLPGINCPSLEASHTTAAAKVPLYGFGCRVGGCGRTFETWAELYHHQKTVHTVQMSKKIVQRRAGAISVKSFFGVFYTKLKKKAGTPKIKKRKKVALSTPKTKIKQRKGDAAAILKIKVKRKTRSGALWNIVAPPIITNDGDEENQNDNSLMNDEEILSSSPEPLDKNSQNEDLLNPSSSNQNVEHESPQYQPTLSEVSNSTAVGTAAVVQSQQHGIGETTSLGGCFCLCGSGKLYKDKKALMGHIQYQTMDPKYTCKICGVLFKKSNVLKRHLKKIHTKSTMKSCELCEQKFWTMEQLERHQGAVHALNSLPPHATRALCQPDTQQNLEGLQGDGLSQDLTEKYSNNIHPTAPSASTSTHHPQSVDVLHLHGVDISKQAQGAFCICGKKYSSKANLDIHIGYYTLEWKFECGMCTNKRFYYLTYLKKHYTYVHKKPNILDEYKAGCRFCAEMFREWKDYHLHMKMEHPKGNKNEKLLKAKPKVINKCITSKKTNFQGKKFNCNVCPQKFKLLSSLQSHQIDVHKAINVLSLFGCQHCGTEFLSEKELLEHSCVYPGVKGPPKRMTRSRTLIAEPTSESVSPSSHDDGIDISHVKIEKVEPEHAIDYSKVRLGFYCKCGARTTGPDAKHNLLRHIKYFNSESHFECSQCQLCFKSTTRLRRHMRTVHDAEYTKSGCGTCGNVFENIIELQQHQRSSGRCRRKRKRIEKIDLASIPTPAPHRDEEYLEELQQQLDKVTTSATQTRTQQNILAMKKVPLSVRQRKPLSLPPPPLPKNNHGKNITKRHLGHYCLCGTKTTNAHTLRNHIAYFISDKKFECELCGHLAVYLAHLKRHLKSVHKLTDSYQLRQMGMGCSLCGESGFATQKQLKNHKNAAHSARSTRNQTDFMEPQPSTSKGVMVPTNGRIRSRQTKKPSIIISTSSRSTSTSSLPKTSRAPASLKLNKIDSYEKKYACPICEDKFPFMSILKRHLERIHKLRNPHVSVCPTCSAVFMSKRELVTHSWTVHAQ